MITLTGLSHAIIFFNSVEGAQKTGISAMMKLCFGSDDEAIAQILYCLTPGNKTPVWTLPVRTSPMATDTFPVFTGKVGEEVLAAVGRAADRFKAFYTSPEVKAGRAWRITKNGIEEIKQEAKQATTPAK